MCWLEECLSWNLNLLSSVQLRGEKRMFQIERTAVAKNPKMVLRVALGLLGCRERKGRT